MLLVMHNAKEELVQFLSEREREKGPPLSLYSRAARSKCSLTDNEPRLHTGAAFESPLSRNPQLDSGALGHTAVVALSAVPLSVYTERG